MTTVPPRRKRNPDESLELDKTLGSYKIQELSLVNKNNRAVGGLLSSADILHVKSSKHRQNSVCDSSLSSGSLGSRSTSPVPVNIPRVPPQPPIRKKRRPAPKPPQINENGSKEEMKTPRPVLISHSRESSDSSGYHEASVLSESPTHGAPLGRSESTSPPDTLPRHGKLLPSQSFTNLATIQPTSRTRLTSSVSNASLNSNGRKKRAAPPPPPSTYSIDEKMKSSTLPTSRAEERIISNVPFVAVQNGDKTPEPVEESNTKVEKVENSVENVSKLIAETKVDVATIKTEAKPVVGKAKRINTQTAVDGSRLAFPGGMGTNRPDDHLHRQLMKEMTSRFKITEERSSLPRIIFEREEQVDVSERPVPKPRTLVGKDNVRDRKVSLSRSQTDSVLLGEEGEEAPIDGKTILTNETLKNVKSAPKMGGDERDDGEESTRKTSRLERWRNVDTLACLNDDEAMQTKSAWLLGDSEASGEVSPTDEQEHDSLNWQYQLPPPPTDFRDTHSPSCTEFGTVTITPDVFKEEDRYAKDEAESRKTKDCQKSDEPKNRETKKPSVMSELTNVSTDSWKAKEKSSSVTNLYLKEDSANNRKLSYSRSFTNELPLKNYKLTAYESFGAENNREDSYEKEIRYKNYKNLEKSLSMECIQTRSHEPENRSEDVFRRPVAPVQKKLKVAKRSASTYNSAQRRSESDLDAETTDNIETLQQHFLDFLKEKRLSSDLNMKSLNVIRHILPQINGAGEKGKTETDYVDYGKPRVTTVPVKVVDFKKKTSAIFEQKVKESVVIIDRERRDERKESDEKPKPEIDLKKVDSVKKYSYHAPPSINFATWGERPKTQVFIKDEDYVTEDKVTKKMEKKPLEEIPKPVIMKKPNPLQFKKPGVKSNYEMFSALPKKKEVTSLTLIKMEEEEKMKRMMEEMKEPSRVPIVCGVELKKEFKDQQCNKSISVTEVTNKPEATIRPTHSVSIYINGSERGNETSVKSNMAAAKPLIPNYTIPKRSTTLMPVVKGFRISEEPNHQSHVNINKICNFSSSNNNNNSNSSGVIANNGFSVGTDRRNESSAIYNQKTKHVSEVSLPPPPPPPPLPVDLPKLKPVSARQIKPKTMSGDPRGQLMEDIRNFRGFNSHKLKTAQ